MAHVYNNWEETQYHNIIRSILGSGYKRDDRTNVGTLSIFSPPPMRFNLESFPLLTTKKTFLRPIFEELMWFIRGQTDASILSDKKVYIWDANGSRDALDKRGLHHLRKGDLGPIYGFQWRHFGATYKDCTTDYSGQGVDQLYNVIEAIMFNPQDRRIILSAWNPAAVPEMALPPCHMFCQFYVANGKLSCQLYQRSADIGLGVPFNIASYSLLTMLIAKFCKLEPGEFIHVIGDAHIYNNHVDALTTQLSREPYKFPKLIINKSVDWLSMTHDNKNIIVKKVLETLESVEYSDIEVVGYVSHPSLQMTMAV